MMPPLLLIFFSPLLLYVDADYFAMPLRLIDTRRHMLRR